MGDTNGFGTWNGGTMMVPTSDQNTWTAGNRLTTTWHSMTSAIGHLTGRHRNDLDYLVELGDR